MFIFAIMVQKMDFEQSQFQRMSVALTEFCLFLLPLLLAWGKSSFKGLKFLLDEYF